MNYNDDYEEEEMKNEKPHSKGMLEISNRFEENKFIEIENKFSNPDELRNFWKVRNVVSKTEFPTNHFDKNCEELAQYGVSNNDPRHFDAAESCAYRTMLTTHSQETLDCDYEKLEDLEKKHKAEKDYFELKTVMLRSGEKEPDFQHLKTSVANFNMNDLNDSLNAYDNTLEKRTIDDIQQIGVSKDKVSMDKGYSKPKNNLHTEVYELSDKEMNEVLEFKLNKSNVMKNIKELRK